MRKPLAWIVGPPQGEPTTDLEHDVAAFYEHVKAARESFGTIAFWDAYSIAGVIWTRWRLRRLSLMRSNDFASLKRTHFNELYMPPNSKPSKGFWGVYREIEELMYPDSGKPDDNKIRAMIQHLFNLHNLCREKNGRDICHREILVVLENVHRKEAVERYKLSVAFRSGRSELPDSPSLRKTGS